MREVIGFTTAQRSPVQNVAPPYKEGASVKDPRIRCSLHDGEHREAGLRAAIRRWRTWIAPLYMSERNIFSLILWVIFCKTYPTILCLSYATLCFIPTLYDTKMVRISWLLRHLYKFRCTKKSGLCSRRKRLYRSVQTVQLYRLYHLTLCKRNERIH